MLTEPRRKARAKLATTAAALSRCPGDPVITEAVGAARRDYYAVALEDHIRSVVEAAPPLTESQRRRLASMLTGDDAA